MGRPRFPSLAICTLLLAYFFTVLPLSSVYAAELAPQGTWQRKLQRGFLNTFFSPLEITHELERVKGKDALIPTWFTGFGRGIWNAGVRAFTGIYEIVTAPLPVPSHYAPLYQPEFSLQYLNFLKDES